MSFLFGGIFAAAGEDVLDACVRHFGGGGRLFEKPFHGFGVRTGGQFDYFGPDHSDPDESLDVCTRDLLDFSRRFPEVVFVHLYANFFGGVGEYSGYACRDGQLLGVEPCRGVVNDDAPLRRLLGYLNVELGKSGYFEPLRRGFFPRESWTKPMPPLTDPRKQGPGLERVNRLAEKYKRAMEPAASEKSIWNRLFRRRNRPDV